MTPDVLFRLYERERHYQKKVFGEYDNNPAFNISTFLHLHEEYLRKAKFSYVTKWEQSLPHWLLSCKEFTLQGSAPVNTYSQIVKNFALHGAALETYINIDPEKWRTDERVNDKWEEK